MTTNQTVFAAMQGGAMKRKILTCPHCGTEMERGIVNYAQVCPQCLHVHEDGVGVMVGEYIDAEGNLMPDTSYEPNLRGGELMYKSKTLRRMPERTREIARLVNDLESAARRLANRVPKIQDMESQAKALHRILESPDRHTYTFTTVEHASLIDVLEWALNEKRFGMDGWSEEQEEAFLTARDKLTKGKSHESNRGIDRF